MSNDLVKRLRDWSEYDEGKINDAREEAADRIEKLEALLDEEAFSQTLFDAVVNQRNRANARIEQLEAALWEIADGAVADNADDACYALMKMARNALEEKKDDR